MGFTSAQSVFKALQPGELFFFKLKASRNAIAGFGFFVHFSTLPVSMAWEVYRSFVGGCRRVGWCGSRRAGA